MLRNSRSVSTRDFTNAIRGALIQRGTTLTQWARANGYNVKTAFAAVYGQRSGKTSREIREKLRRILGKEAA